VIIVGVGFAGCRLYQKAPHKSLRVLSGLFGFLYSGFIYTWMFVCVCVCNDIYSVRGACVCV